VPVCLTEPGIQKCFDEVPRNGWSNGSAAHADDIHVIVLDPLPGREMIVNQSGSDAWNLVGADGGAYSAAADRYAAFHLASGHSHTEWSDEVGIIIVGNERMRAEIDHVMAFNA
jgi:hypothetical protein